MSDVRFLSVIPERHVDSASLARGDFKGAGANQTKRIRGPHDNLILRLFGADAFLPPHCHKHFIRNNGLMDSGVEIPFHEAIVFDLDSTRADRLLEHCPLNVLERVNRMAPAIQEAFAGGCTGEDLDSQPQGAVLLRGGGYVIAAVPLPVWREGAAFHPEARRRKGPFSSLPAEKCPHPV